MPEYSDKHLKLMKDVTTSGLVDFQKLGQVVADVTPQLFDPGVVADNYIASGYSDVVKVWKTDLTSLGLDHAARIQDMVQQQVKTNIGQVARGPVGPA